MIYFDSMSKIHLYQGKVDEIWCIVRNLKSFPKVDWCDVQWESDLSPSQQLYSDTMTWKNNGEWTQKKFDVDYHDRFLEQMHEPRYKNALNKLFVYGQKKNILCVCYCHNPDMCHRKLVYGLIQGAYAERGIKTSVMLDFDTPDCSNYYKEWKG